MLSWRWVISGVRKGSIEEALILHYESLPESPRIPFMFSGLAGVANARGQFERATRLLGAVQSDWVVQWSSRHPEISPYESTIAAVKTQLGETAFALAWAEGRAMTLDQAVAYALQNKGLSTQMTHHDPEINQTLIDPLSERELQVLRLMAEGLSNAEIAQALILSVETVKVHARNIYGKLGVRDRTQAVIQAQTLKLF